jgi:hypothetical protein
MLSRSLPTLAAVLASSFLWALAMQELALQPVTNTGTQPTHRAPQQ